MEVNTFSAKRDHLVPPERLGTIHGCTRDLSVPLGIVVLLLALFRQHCIEALSDSVQWALVHADGTHWSRSIMM
ncbi:hypothetical protein J6590_073198 [Homalodisca vitripennis]|nr:hypothetical protein J6590_073198 [Homalodisca vitripennis]